MDSIRVPKVENVLCRRLGSSAYGTLHLTAHHLIFHYADDKLDEMWVPYPLVSLVTRLPQTLQGQCPITFHLRTFETFSLSFGKESDASDVFESVKELTVATSISQLYAFFYQPNPPLPSRDGWSIYSPREEFGRMGLGTRTKAWRFTDINKDYSFSPTYPARMVVPTRISDTTLQYASKYRSKCRLPALTYLHWANYGSITRSSQPMVGITQNRSVQDEKLIEAVFQSHHTPDSRVSNAPIYGATATNIIIDARPTANAVANTAKGAGTENMDHYKEARKAYLGIDNIHTMRDSLNKVVDALRDADSLAATLSNDLSANVHGIPVLDRQALRRSGWLRHISAILEGTLLITKNIHVNNSHVLIHCSDGWDRTSQLSAVSQICLDPYYRTYRGFQILIEKDWLSFGHMFLERCGHLSSDKFFITPSETAGSTGGAEAATAFLASVQNRFVSQHHVKETSPVFHQFLEAVRQIQRQFPDRFEFNERFLRQLHYHLYSCQFGTFLFNNERERRSAEGNTSPYENTISVWDFFNSQGEKEKNLNSTYDRSLDDPTSRTVNADMGVLFAKPKDVRFWHELYGKTDEEMNGRVAAPQVGGTELASSTGGTEDDLIQRTSTPTSVPLPPSPALSQRPISPAHPRDSPRSTSPPTASISQELSPLSSNITGTPQRGSPKPPSNLSTSSPWTNSPTSPTSAVRAWPAKQDFLANSGVKSMWGKLSSNASTAFSVVQDAYGGLARDLRSTSISDDGDGTSKTAELRDRDTLNAWGDDEQPSTSISRGTASTYTTSSNPWASIKARSSLPATQLDNPWNTTRSISPRRRDEPLRDLFGSSPLPLDPNVESPTPRRLHSTDQVPRTASVSTLDSLREDPPVAVVEPGKSDTDPLGVGPL